MAENPILRIGPPVHHVEIDGDALYLGRDCHLAAFIGPLLNKTVSNRHCVVRQEADGRWMLEDLGSSNGTWMRNTRLFGKMLLHTGDVFTLGRQGAICECWSGFGGTGPDATVAEEERRATHAPPSPAEDRAPTVVAGRDGSAEKPYRVGKMPEIVLRHQRTGQEYRAAGYTIVLGRDPDAAQVLIRADDERHVSGRHFEIQFRSDGSVIGRDLGSRNGSWVNDRPVKGDVPVRSGDRIVLGAEETTLRVVRLVTG